MGKIKKIGLLLLIALYLLAGINHFIHPSFYIAIIPHYIPYPKLMNILAGGFEILFALMLISPKTRPLAAWGIVLMLITFLSVHIDMVIKAPYHVAGLNVKLWAAWLRVALQPVLIWWAWVYRKP